MLNKILVVTFVLFLFVVVMAAVAPIVVQDLTSGNNGGALDSIQTSIDGLNDALEDSPVGDAFETMDAIQ